jgi:hypothetical protein
VGSDLQESYDAMAAVDRLVHRSVILEFFRDKSYREEAAERQQACATDIA